MHGVCVLARACAHARWVVKLRFVLAQALCRRLGPDGYIAEGVTRADLEALLSRPGASPGASQGGDGGGGGGGAGGGGAGGGGRGPEEASGGDGGGALS